MMTPRLCLADGSLTGETRTIRGITYLLPPPDLDDPRAKALINPNVETDDSFYAKPVLEGSPTPSKLTAFVGGSPCAGDQLLVKFKPDALPSATTDLLAVYKSDKLCHMLRVDWHVISVPAWLDVTAFKTILDKEPMVEKVEYNWIVQAGSTPADYYYSALNTYSTSSGSTFSDYYQWGLHNINMEPAWTRTFGDSRITIAVCDSGINTSHPDLNPKIARDSSGALRGYSLYPTMPPLIPSRILLDMARSFPASRAR